MRARSTFLLASSLVGFLGAACGHAAPAQQAATGDDAIVGVPQTDVERESIGSSWLWAQASWVEALATSPLTASRAYWLYWDWFDQIADGYVTQITTGGNFETARGIIRKYGVVDETSFLGGGADVPDRALAALATLDASLATGPLSLPSARRDRALVRREVDRAFALSPDAAAMLDGVFGPDVSRTFLGAAGAAADPTGTAVRRASDLAVSYPSASAPTPAPTRHLSDALDEFTMVYANELTLTEFFARAKRAVDDHEPVLFTWFVDFGALESRDNARRGAFNLETLNELGPSEQGGHTALLVSAGVDPATNALASFRVNPDWGDAHPDKVYSPNMPPYHDLWLDYLSMPVKRCMQRAGSTDPADCPYTIVPAQSLVLPPGY